MKKYLFIPALLLLLVGVYSFKSVGNLTGKIAIHNQKNSFKGHTINTRTAKELRDFFKYSPDRIPLVSAHRGGPRKGFPENCLATFENTLAHTPALLEIDPRYTKDGQIVLMHDATLDRTTNGRGKVIDFTLAEIKKLRLKDTEGNLTNYAVPTLDEALQWAKGKTILVIDAKDVPIEVRANKIIQNKAEANAILISYSLEDTKKVYQLHPELLMEVMMGKSENLTLMDNSGVPWENVVAFVSHDLLQDNTIINALHKRGAMGIYGSSRNLDQQFISGQITANELANGYRHLIKQDADIIEADLGIEAGEALKSFKVTTSTKAKYFKN